MIVLLIILVVAAIGGMVAYVIMQYSGFGSSSAPVGSTPYVSTRGSGSSGPIAERIADAPPGCLITVMAAIAVWVILWLIVLVLGLRLLTA